MQTWFTEEICVDVVTHEFLIVQTFQISFRLLYLTLTRSLYSNGRDVRVPGWRVLICQGTRFASLAEANKLLHCHIINADEIELAHTRTSLACAD